MQIFRDSQNLFSFKNKSISWKVRKVNLSVGNHLHAYPRATW